MQRQSFLVLGVFLTLVGGAAYVLNRPREAGMQRIDLTGPAGALDRIELSGPHAAVLRRDGEAWLLEPSNRPVDPQLAEQATRFLTSFTSSDLVTEDTGRFVELGVEGSEATALRASATGDVRVQLQLAKMPAGGEADFAGPGGYVRQGDRVFAEHQGLAELFVRDAAGWEDRTVVHEAQQDIARLEVRRHNVPGYAFERGEAGWHLANSFDGRKVDGPKRFDGQQVSLLVDQLVAARASALVDQDPGEATTGLGEADADKWTWVLGEAAQERFGFLSRSLWVGKARPEGGVWARVEGRSLPFVLEEASVTSLKRDYADMADLLMMATADVEQATSLLLEPEPGQQTLFVKNGDDWQVARGKARLPKGFVADGNKVKARMRQILLTRAIGVAPSKTRPSGHVHGRAVITLADKTEHALRFGQLAKHHATQAYEAQGSADGQVYYASKPLRTNVLEKADSLGKATPPSGMAAKTPLPDPSMPQGLDSLPPEVQESIRRQLAAAGQAP